MKFSAFIAAALVGTSSAFQLPLVAKTNSALRAEFNRPSAALPFTGETGCPSTLDGSLAGDAGFDPIGFSTADFAQWFDLESPNGSMSSLYWLREAELAHGRIAQLAVLGFIWPALFGTFPGNEFSGGVDSYNYPNPIEAIDNVNSLALLQIAVGMIWVELKRVSTIKKQGASRVPGDLLLGQGEGRWNPFNLNYTPEQYAEKQVQEIKHCRLAMLGAVGLYLQAKNSGFDIVSQLGNAIVSPEFASKAGYYFPDGI